ncbi:mitochondrial carrier domain-containing protein [Leucosporidium creatinivorum]|uniref:Mitochondrial carrier domain-containing protein n=1 Tax=Leucosporidium creatinivorum TaxID=106004 RepID=A0A1Y2G2B0_9BASI|nr:mitochondrial carrier domain-containing protein [Leucosporidium creatinivorum]
MSSLSSSSSSVASSSSSSSPTPRPPPPPTPTPSFFPSYSLDQAFAGITAGIISTLCMQPLDLLKVKLQVRTTAVEGRGLTAIWSSLREIVLHEGGVKGLYRGITPNLVGNASSWGLYFLWYTMLKTRAQELNGVAEGGKLSAGQHLLASAESGVITAVMTNPLWVVKTRMFTTSATQTHAYRGVLDGLNQIARQEGIRGLSKGMVLALFGVSNGAIQFMTYEELKRWRQEVKRKRLGVGATEEEVKALTNTEYILMSGSAKLIAIGITYPYQVIRSRIQYQPTDSPPYTSIPNCITRTYASEGLRGFYKGLATNAVRILPGTCVTFVVYEQVSRWLSRKAGEKERGGGG